MQRTCALLFAAIVVTAFIATAAVSGGTATAGELTRDTAFSYRGQLAFHGEAAEGLYDFEFVLFDRARGGQPLGFVVRSNERVVSGAFETELDFGPVPAGAETWLEVRVRETGSAASTTLDPRQQIKAASACTVDSDLVVDGSIEEILGEGGFKMSFVDAGGNELAGIGAVTYPLFHHHLALRNGGSNAVYLWENGDVGIGIVPAVPLHVAGGGDAALGTGTGCVEILETLTNKSLVLDTNEIQARVGISAAPLYLNNNGGTVDVGSHLRVAGDVNLTGALTIGIGANLSFPTVSSAAISCLDQSGVAVCDATCNSGKLIGGACSSEQNTQLLESRPLSATQWRCRYNLDSAVGLYDILAMAICANLP